jgi:hypothetical protein
MKLLFCNERSIKLIREEFAKSFPYLTLEILSRACLPGQTSYWDKKLSGSTVIGKISPMPEPVVIDLPASTSIASLEQQIHDKTGLTAKIYRRINHDWQKIRHTKDSLQSQNALGAASQTIS